MERLNITNLLTCVLFLNKISFSSFFIKPIWARWASKTNLGEKALTILRAGGAIYIHLTTWVKEFDPGKTMPKP